MLWLKSFHIISMVTWFSGLFYLPRLFVYHSTCLDTAGDNRFKIMERKLFYGIATPGAALTLIFGLKLLQEGLWEAYRHALWLHIKLLLVALLIIYHLMCGYYLYQFKYNRNTHTHVFYRWFNEFPVLLLIGIVILVVVKPF